MRLLLRNLVLSLTVLTTLGVGPAATAAPRHTGGAAATAAPDDAVARLRNRLSAQAEAELERLSQTSGDIAFGDLTDDQKSSLVTDIRYDLQNLAALAGSIGEATTVEQLRGLRGDLHEFYPHVYDVAVAYLQDANMLVARVAANDALVPTLREGFAERAQAANDGARDALGTPYVGEISAHHGRADADGLRRAVAGLAAIRAQLRSVTHIVAEERRFRRLQDRLQAQAYEKQLQLSRVRGKVVDSDLTDDEKMAISDAIGHTEHVASELLSSASAATSIEQLRGVAYGLDPIYPHAYDVLLALAEQEPGLATMSTSC